jgi:hydroxypyruvate reductase
MNRFDPRLLKSGDTKTRREKVLPILAAALEAVDPVIAVKRQMSLQDDSLVIGQRVYDLSEYEMIYAIGGGKAGGAMAKAAEEILGPRLTAGLVNTKYGYLADTKTVRINEAGHPIPDAAGMRGASQMVDIASGATQRDLVICLISGGGSALMTLPVEGITLADVEALTSALLRCGATINEINAIRKHLSQIKGGNLSRLAYPAEVVSLILSDVVGSPLDVIASGPTVPDSSTFSKAYGIVERYGLLDELPPSIVQHLRQGKEGSISETPKEGDPIFSKTHNLIIASNEVAAQAAILHSGQPVPRPACVVAGGETTVTISGQGKGGRNQELALAAAIQIEDLEEVIIVALATDGTDGPTDAAGAIADGSTLRRAREKDLSASDYLADNDSYHFFACRPAIIWPTTIPITSSRSWRTLSSPALPTPM